MPAGRQPTDAHNDVAGVSPVFELILGPVPNTMFEVTGSMRGLTPKGLMIIQKILLYRERFCSVSPKRRKNALAKSGLDHWSNLILKFVQNPADRHSTDVAVPITENVEWMASHPGQNPIKPPCIASKITCRIPGGNVTKMSNTLKARSRVNRVPFKIGLLARASSSSLLCFKYVKISLATEFELSITLYLSLYLREYTVIEANGNSIGIVSINKIVKPVDAMALLQPSSSTIWKRIGCTT